MGVYLTESGSSHVGSKFNTCMFIYNCQWLTLGKIEGLCCWTWNSYRVTWTATKIRPSSVSKSNLN